MGGGRNDNSFNLCSFFFLFLCKLKRSGDLCVSFLGSSTLWERFKKAVVGARGKKCGRKGSFGSFCISSFISLGANHGGDGGGEECMFGCPSCTYLFGS